MAHPATARNFICRKALLEPIIKKYVSVNVIFPFHCYTRHRNCCRKIVSEKINSTIYSQIVVTSEMAHDCVSPTDGSTGECSSTIRHLTTVDTLVLSESE
jgi:hypothetical protein